MSIKVALNHKTIYRYDRPVQLNPQTVRLRPAPHCRTPILSYSMDVSPDNHFCNWMQDPQSNFQARLVFQEKVRHFAVEIDLTADMTVINPFDFFLEDIAQEFPFEYPESLQTEIAPFLKKQHAGGRFRDYLASIDTSPEVTIDFLVALNQRLENDFKYLIRLEPGVQTCDETLKKGSGSCRDTSWLLVQLLRHLGLAARFVSGYLIQLKPDVKSLDGPSGTDNDFTDLHAWAEVYLPGAGWVGLDPTSGLFAGEGHIPLAATPDPQSAAPISGSLGECEVEFHHEMSVTRVLEDPRVTLPYDERQWDEIAKLGASVDRSLRKNDVRLTMGGEPTFVSIDDMDGDEWNTAALGEAKRERAGILLRRLRDRFGEGALLHYGQGKWYPGEVLPRWSLACIWRRDGEAVWSDDALCARDGEDYGADEAQAREFIEALAGKLGIDPKMSLPGYEDVFYYLWRERRLPENLDPMESKLDDPMERNRFAKVFEKGLDEVTGHIIPLYADRPGKWRSCQWTFRGGNMYLLPGDSPMGFRLPLASLPWEPEEERHEPWELDPMAPRYPLRPELAREGEEKRIYRLQQPGDSESTDAGVPAASVAEEPETDEDMMVRTALCAEPRDGILHVFMPPLPTLETYLELVTAIEQTASDMGKPVRIEGYTPPFDPRIQQIRVTPDPGVIEVNIHPAASWEELTENTTILYEEARLARLGTEKFMVDGRHTGTGGGNHVVIGGPSPAESPILRRPDLLKSLVAYWNNHPSLSYIFSSLFVGPTSQAPRAEEARVDASYELEIALEQVKRETGTSPWLADRVFRNLLVDVTGNTHRSEFCIDKLYSPDSATGRLGLVEFRAFEMPPHARMSLTQQLLLRALVAHFWERPYEHDLVHWGSELYDKWALPHFLRHDLQDVAAELRRYGFDFKTEWFDPHIEFRFPTYGDVTYDGVKMELRQAVEPWYVLGEEPAGGATARYVDSSVERLELKVSGMTHPRHVVACNGVQVPLHPTGTNGEFVAGIRFRAWQPPHCLHPTIGVHAPLTFDVVDKWQDRSMGGCRYHVAHPGGRSYETPPVNAYEAESRRVSRFFKFGHSPGEIAVKPPVRHEKYPMTLDLRKRWE